jgi:flagellar biosynthesis/type III secretory pathway ATPase
VEADDEGVVPARRVEARLAHRVLGGVVGGCGETLDMATVCPVTRWRALTTAPKLPSPRRDTSS